MQRNPKLLTLHIPTLPHRTPALRPHPLVRPPSSISPHTSALSSSRLFNFMPPLRYISSLQRPQLHMLKISSHHLFNTHNGAMPPCSHAWTSIKILGLSLSRSLQKFSLVAAGPRKHANPQHAGGSSKRSRQTKALPTLHRTCTEPSSTLTASDPAPRLPRAWGSPSLRPAGLFHFRTYPPRPSLART